MSHPKEAFLALSTSISEKLIQSVAENTLPTTPQEEIEYYARGLMTVAPSWADQVAKGEDSAYQQALDVMAEAFTDIELNPVAYNQASCEACTLCLMFDLLDWQPPQSFLVWLEKLVLYPLVDNNWQWFGAIIGAYVRKHGGRANYDNFLKRIDDFYVGRGWYLDGNKYDMYSGWVMQFLPHFFARLVPAKAEYYLRGHAEFLRDWASLFDVSGNNVQWGRSPIYKYAAANPFVACWFNPAYESRTTYSNLVMANILSYPNPLALGAYVEGDCEVDSYSCKYSPLWCNSTLLAAMLPADSMFFNGEQVTEWWNHEVHLGSPSFRQFHIINGRPNNQYINMGQHVEPTHPNLDKRYLFNDR